ncbi:MAG: tRNA pseudouridine(55) synthase TruB [Geobacteraceae bacterium]|nr:tRNA pseudouridine(55) synthase TruB [Geobacteraceae bacterium]
MDGFLVVDKPIGITSHDVVAILRRTLSQKKIGHTGTLDPFATGVLPIALGEGTKAIPYLDESIKEYKALLRLGVSTDTLDLTGTVIAQRDTGHLRPEDIQGIIPAFIGSICQIPPMYSAVKQGGVPLYKLARKGETVERKERLIEIHSLVVDRITLPDVAITVRCSKGTYVRTLAEDIGEALGVGAHLTELRRTASGTFVQAASLTLDELSSLSMDELTNSRVVSIRSALDHLTELELSESGCKRLRNGIAPTLADLLSVNPGQLHQGRVKLIFDGVLQAVADLSISETSSEAVNIKLVRVFNLLSPLHPQV